jgi:hypothetical protein
MTNPLARLAAVLDAVFPYGDQMTAHIVVMGTREYQALAADNAGCTQTQRPVAAVQQENTMTAKKLILIVALVASASSAALAKMPRTDSSGAQTGAIFEDAQHGAGAASQR